MKGSVSFLPVEHDPWADAERNLPSGDLGLSQGPMSWTDWLPFVKEAVKIYGKEKLGEMLGAVTAPGDALTGKLDPGTPEGLRRVQALAGLAMGGPGAPKGGLASGLKLGKLSDEQLLKELDVPKSAWYEHPHSEPLTSHPATYGMSEQEARAAGELLEALKLYPNLYKSPAEAIKGLEDFVEPHEIPHFESAAKKLEDWAGPHGFKFEAEPTVAPELPVDLSAPKVEPKSSNEFAYNKRPSVPIEEALYPINWGDLHSTVARPGQTATGPYAENLRRAEALGFNTNFPIYHGAANTKVKAPETPAEGLWGPKAEEYHAFLDPKDINEDFEPGIFTADTPEIAGMYSGGSDAPQLQGQTFPLFANPKKTLAVDWRAVSPNGSYSGDVMHRLIKEAHKKKADALVVQGLGDVGGLQNQYIFLRPNVLRSQFARFDPKYAESANLTRSGGLGALPLFVPVDHDPFAEPSQ